MQRNILRLEIRHLLSLVILTEMARLLGFKRASNVPFVPAVLVSSSLNSS